MLAHPVFPAQSPGSSLTFLQRIECFKDTTKCTRDARKRFTSSADVLKQKPVQVRRQADIPRQMELHYSELCMYAVISHNSS